MITDLGILRPDPETRELTLVALHPDATVKEAKEATGWDLKVAEQPETTDSPTEDELRILRDLKARTEASRKKVGKKLPGNSHWRIGSCAEAASEHPNTRSRGDLCS